MRVLLLSSSSGSRGGGEIFLLYLAQALREAGHEPILWCASHQRMDELAESFSEIGKVIRDDYPNSYLDRRFRVFSAAFDIRVIRRLARRFSEIDCDVVHINKQTLEDGLDLLEAIRHINKPIVGTIHITQSNCSLGAFAGVWRDTLSRQRLNRIGDIAWTAVSDARADELRAVLSGDVHTIYNAVSEAPAAERTRIREEIIEPRGWPQNTILVVCVARLVTQKDPSRFIRFAAKLHRRVPNTRFLWIGDGELRESFLQQACNKGLGSVIACTGWSKEPRRFLAGADLYLHPAAYEGLPLAILEAMAAGLPCVLSPEIASEANVFDESTVIIAKETDDDWLELVCSENSRRHYAQTAKRLYLTHFRPEALADAFVKLYSTTNL
ncbi:glycosyltransferase family 4 protein [bacterium]|nr:glycosyltransferase family 4 protein [bacterium]